LLLAKLRQDELSGGMGIRGIEILEQNDLSKNDEEK
jgi:hypothetical protein